MLALVLDEGLDLISEYPRPTPGPEDALIRVRLAGVCSTDLEILRGYRQFRGVLGHEFVGTVVACDQGEWIGRRVVGEINIGCNECSLCRQGVYTHCRSRMAIGILGRDGALAEFLTLPLSNLLLVPDDVPDEAAVFTEPLAAALQVLGQVEVGPENRVAVIGDGKLGLLVAQVLATTGAEVTVIGRHPKKLALAAGWGLCTAQGLDSALRQSEPGTWDLVAECTGNPEGLAAGLELIRPLGTIVLKSTIHGLSSVDLNRVVVDEIRLVGSRCGPYGTALRWLQAGRVDVTSLIEARYPLAEGVRALEHAGRRGVLKVLVQP